MESRHAITQRLEVGKREGGHHTNHGCEISLGIIESVKDGIAKRQRGRGGGAEIAERPRGQRVPPRAQKRYKYTGLIWLKRSEAINIIVFLG